MEVRRFPEVQGDCRGKLCAESYLLENSNFHLLKKNQKFWISRDSTLINLSKFRFKRGRMWFAKVWEKLCKHWKLLKFAMREWSYQVPYFFMYTNPRSCQGFTKMFFFLNNMFKAAFVCGQWNSWMCEVTTPLHLLQGKLDIWSVLMQRHSIHQWSCWH